MTEIEIEKLADAIARRLADEIIRHIDFELGQAATAADVDRIIKAVKKATDAKS